MIDKLIFICLIIAVFYECSSMSARRSKDKRPQSVILDLFQVVYLITAIAGAISGVWQAIVVIAVNAIDTAFNREEDPKFSNLISILSIAMFILWGIKK